MRLKAAPTCQKPSPSSSTLKRGRNMASARLLVWVTITGSRLLATSRLCREERQQWLRQWSMSSLSSIRVTPLLRSEKGRSRVMLNADLENSVINIDDFAYETVERVINNCCGRIVAFNTPESIMEMIRFCEEYNIKPPIIDDFVRLADYAWKHSIPSLQDKCSKVFYKHVDKLSRNPDFLQFDPNLMAQLFHDTAEFEVGGYRGDPDGESDVMQIPGAPPGVKWGIDVFPWGKSGDGDALEVYLRVIGARATVTGQLEIVNYEAEDTFTEEFKFEFVDEKEQGFDNLANSGCESAFKVTCVAAFMIHPPKKAFLASVKVFEMVDPTKPTCFDATIKTAEGDIKINRGFLSMISPVFSGIFGLETTETKTGIVNITDFTHETVKNALAYCYGRNVKQKPMTEVTGMLRFYEKYGIRAPIKKLEAWLKANLTVDNFVPIAAYAFTHSLEPLQADCGQLFHKHIEDLSHRPEFIQLDPDVVSAIFKAGAAAEKVEEAKKKKEIDDEDE
uniref:BTB domain-containing protein n=2 Tax=Panagrellus redivivus TaxID=6233 RepID=A0A7E4W6A3_PANRE